MLAPQELKNKEFTKSIRGYNPQEVDEHIDFLIEKYTEAYRENSELERKLQSVIAMLDQIKDDEESIRTTLINAQKAGEKIIRDANDRADSIVNGIKGRCDEVLAKFRTEVSEEVNNLWRIRTGIIDFKQKLYTLYSGHLEDLRNISVNEITDIIIPDTGKIINDVVSDASKEFKRDLEENPDPAPDSDEDAAETAAPAEEEATESAPSFEAEEPAETEAEVIESEDKAEDHSDDGDDIDDIDDFIKLIEEKANE